MATRESVVGDFSSLPEMEQNKAFQDMVRVRSLANPTGSTVNVIWLIIVIALAILLLGGTFLVFWLTKNGKDTEAILPLVAGALGALAGLLAPSPTTDQGGS